MSISHMWHLILDMENNLSNYSRVSSGERSNHYLEILLGSPIHYFICQFHGNELPFRTVFYKYDGKPSVPEHWCCPIKKQIKKPLAELPVIAFHAINDFPVLNEDVEKDLSWDQKYLYRILGAAVDKLSALEPGLKLGYITEYISQVMCSNIKPYL